VKGSLLRSNLLGKVVVILHKIILIHIVFYISLALGPIMYVLLIQDIFILDLVGPVLFFDNIGGADCSILDAILATHIPVPLVDLTWFEAKLGLEFVNLGSLPDWVLFELGHEDFVLLGIFPETFLCFLDSLDSVANHDSGDKRGIIFLVRGCI